MPELRVARAFNIDPSRFPLWAGLIGLPRFWRFGVAVYSDVDQDIVDHWWVQAHTEAAIIADGDLILQDVPSAQLIENTNRKHLVSEQVVATLVGGVEPNYSEAGALGRQPCWQHGVLEPAPFWPTNGTRPAFRVNTMLVTESGVMLPLITFPPAPKWKDSAIVHSGQAFWFHSGDATVTALVKLRASTDETGRRVFSADDVLDTVAVVNPLSRRRIKRQWRDDPAWHVLAETQARAVAARATWEPVDLPDVVYGETLTQPPLARPWEPAPTSPVAFPPTPPGFAMQQRANARYAAEYIARWVVPVPSEPEKPVSQPFVFVGPETPIPTPRLVEPEPASVPATPTPAAHVVQLAYVEGDRTEDAKRWQYGRLPGRVRQAVSYAEWRAAA